MSSLLTYALIQAFLVQRKTASVKDWLQVHSATVWIVPTYLEQESKYPHMRYYVCPPFDAQSSNYLVNLLHQADVSYPQRKIVGSHRFQESLLQDNLVTLCLPQRNQYARIILGIYSQIYTYHQDPETAATLAALYANDTLCKEEYFGLKWAPLKLEDGGEIQEWKIRHFGRQANASQAWYGSDINAHPDENIHIPGRENSDYALVVKGPNPFNPAATVLVVCGIHGIGTLGGALFLYQRSQELYRLYPARGQVHLIEVRYSVKPHGDNYVDSEILTLKCLHYQPLPERF